MKHARALHYSDVYRSLSLHQSACLDDIVVEYRGSNHGTPVNPIKLSYDRFRVNSKKVKLHLDALVNAGFIKYKSGQKKRQLNEYYLNFELLHMSPPKDWDWANIKDNSNAS